MNKIEDITDQFLAADYENELTGADAKLLATSQFEPVYDSVELSEAVRIAELTEFRKTISRRKAKFDEDKPRFLGYISNLTLITLRLEMKKIWLQYGK